jgi:hypothetical protein
VDYILEQLEHLQHKQINKKITISKNSIVKTKINKHERETSIK